MATDREIAERLLKGLDDYLHAVHPASQRESARAARELIPWARQKLEAAPPAPVVSMEDHKAVKCLEAYMRAYVETPPENNFQCGFLGAVMTIYTEDIGREIEPGLRAKLATIALASDERREFIRRLALAMGYSPDDREAWAVGLEEAERVTGELDPA